MKDNHKTLKLYYNSDAHVGKKTLAYAHTITDNVVDIDVKNTPITETQLLELFTMMDSEVSPLDIIDEQSDIYRNDYAGKDFDMATWAQIIVQNPTLLHYPIATVGNKAIVCRINQDINKLDNWNAQDYHR